MSKPEEATIAGFAFYVATVEKTGGHHLEFVAVGPKRENEEEAGDDAGEYLRTYPKAGPAFVMHCVKAVVVPMPHPLVVDLPQKTEATHGPV